MPKQVLQWGGNFHYKILGVWRAVMPVSLNSHNILSSTLLWHSMWLKFVCFFFFFFFGQMKHYFTNKSTMPCGWSLNDQATHTVLKLHTISGPKSSHFHTFCGPRWKSNLGTTRLFRSPKNITPRSMLLGESHSPERFCNGSMHDHYNILESRCRSPLASHFGGTITCK
jgi:hypothetical protein